MQSAVLRNRAQLGEQQTGADVMLFIEKLRVALDGVGDIADVALDAGFVFFHIDLRHIDGAAQGFLHPS